jgi:hypothetical protein
MNILKVGTAVLLLSAGTFAMAQQRNDQMGPDTRQPPKIDQSDKDKGMGSRPMGPPATTTAPSTSNAESDKQPVTPKNLEKEGKSGNN